LPYDLPLTVGAALPVGWLEHYRDWLFEKDRDLELQSFHKVEVLDGDWRSLADEANRVLDGFKGRLGIHGPFWGFTIHSRDPAIRAVVTRRMMQGLDICAALGATQMVIHSPYTPWDYNNLPMSDDGPQDVLDDAHATLATVVKRAEDQGVELVVENTTDKDPDQRIALIDSFASPAVRASVDTGHAHLAFGTQLAPPVDYFIRAAGQRLAHVHLQDADGYGDRHWRIGEGTIRWPAVFRAIAALETRPRLLLELRDPAGVPASMEFLSGLGLAG
jgi:sugar phosphate isomerase/epimerase